MYCIAKAFSHGDLEPRDFFVLVLICRTKPYRFFGIRGYGI